MTPYRWETFKGIITENLATISFQRRMLTGMISRSPRSNWPH